MFGCWQTQGQINFYSYGVYVGSDPAVITQCLDGSWAAVDSITGDWYFN